MVKVRTKKKLPLNPKIFSLDLVGLLYSIVSYCFSVTINIIKQ